MMGLYLVGSVLAVGMFWGIWDRDERGSFWVEMFGTVLFAALSWLVVGIVIGTACGKAVKDEVEKRRKATQ